MYSAAAKEDLDEHNSEHDRLRPEPSTGSGGGRNGAAAEEPSSGAAPPPQGRGSSTAHTPGDDSEGRPSLDTMRAIERLSSGVTLFSTRRPQNFVAGLSSGLKNVTRGVLAGTASLVAMPVMGYKQDGVKGAAKNFAMGLAACAALSVGGVLSGTAQIVRGAVNTPEAVREMLSNEKMWHHGRREWIEVRLQIDMQSVPHDDSDIIVAARRRQTEEDAAAGLNRPSASPAAPTASSAGLYELLEVPRTASSSEVRRAYAKMALKHHPDKNVGDPQASERFKAVNEAYRILSDEAARAEYDRIGQRPGDNGTHETRLAGLHLHPLQELLGGEALLPWVGHLRIVVVYMNSDFTFTPEEAIEWQRRRVLRIASHMAQFLATAEELHRTEGPLAVTEFYTRRVREMFAANHGREIAALLAARWHLVALRYKSAADGSVIGRGNAIVEDCRQSVVSAGNSAQTVIKTLKNVHAQRQLTADDTGLMLLQFAESDIIDTVDTAVDMVLHDQCVSRDDRWIRMHHLASFAEFVHHKLADPRGMV